MPKTQRKYILLGHLTAKYRGDDAISSDISKNRNFDIELYDITIDQASIRDEKEITGQFAGQSVKELFPSGNIRIKPAAEAPSYLIEPRPVFVIAPTISKVSKSGHQTHGEISGLAYFDATQKEFEYRPVKLPYTASTKIDIEFKPIKPIPPTLPPETGEKPNIFEILSFLFLLTIAVVYTYSFFSILPTPLVILLGCIGLIVFLVSIIPDTWSEWAQKYLRKPFLVIAQLAGIALLIVSLVLLSVPIYSTAAVLSIILLLIFLRTYARVILKLLAILGLILLFFYIPIIVDSIDTSTRVETYNPLPYEPKEDINSEPISTRETIINNDTLITLEWRGPENEKYKVQYPVISRTVKESETQRQDININITGEQDFKYVFSAALARESLRTQTFLNALDSIRNTNDLERNYFRQVLINLAQQIEYYQLVPGPCQSSIESCTPYVKFGFYTPTEFLYHLNGDCDTKALFLYFILDEFNYEVAILGSLFYQHAMIALPSDELDGADYFTIAGKKLYPVETTTPGWEIGEMPPITQNKQFWTPILISN